MNKLSKKILKALQLNGLDEKNLPTTEKQWTYFLSTLNGFLNVPEEPTQEEKISKYLTEVVGVIEAGFVIFGPDKKLIFCNDKYKSLYSKIKSSLIDSTTYIDILTTTYLKYPELRKQFGTLSDYLKIKTTIFPNMQILREEHVGEANYLVHDCALNDGTIISLINDITEQKQKEDALKKREAQFQAIISALPGSVSWIDRDLNYLGVNSNLAHQNQINEEEFIGKKLGFLKTKTNPDMVNKIQNFFDSSENTVQFETQINSAKGVKHILVCAKKYAEDNQAVIVSIDLTPQKELQREVELERQRLIHSSKMSALGEMAAGMGHEINNPLTVISTKAQMLKVLVDTGKINDKYVTEAADQIIKTSEKITNIIKGLKVLARQGENDPLSMHTLKSIIDETLSFSKSRLLNHQIDLRMLPLPDNIYINCRPDQISQVLLNLINNAHDAILNLPKEKRWIEIGFKDRGEVIEISITDSGGGIDKDIQDKLFQPFFTTKEVGKGTGLGLSISQGILRSHNGNIYYDQTSKHTRFIIEFPKHHNKIKTAA